MITKKKISIKKRVVFYLIALCAGLVIGLLWKVIYPHRIALIPMMAIAGASAAPADGRFIAGGMAVFAEIGIIISSEFFDIIAN